MRISLILWVLAAAFCVAALAGAPPWVDAVRWAAAGLALLTVGLLFSGTTRDQL